ncbi:MAG: TRAM domain-containing protein [Acidimicrobiales bacterium]
MPSDDELLTIRIERPATGGGVGRAPDGRVSFVRNSLVNELVRVQVTEATSKFYRGEAIEILEPSPERVSPPCPYAHPFGCGGCELQHADASAQNEWKSALVAEHLRRIAGLEWDIDVVSGSLGEATRTRLRCGVDEQSRLCLRKARSNDLVPIESCWVAQRAFDEAFSHPWPGVQEVELRAIGDGEPFAVTRSGRDAYASVEVRSLAGAPLDPSTHSRVGVAAHVFRVGPRSFWQSHRDAPTTLSEAVMELVRLESGDDAVDLYSGVGLFSVPLARRVGDHGRVTAVESSPYAVRDARENATGLRQVKVREWSVTPRSVNDTVRENSVVVLDPPRQGLARGVVDALAARRPRQVVYVSCDAATFARDLKNFLGHGFVLSDLRVFDLFPMTEHVEIVANLDSPT